MADGVIQSELLSADWNGEWMRLQAARRRCAATMVANSSPRYDLHVMNAIGASVTRSNGFVYAFNILIQM
ncbi:MAG: hypothetical protein SPG85_02960, partial [Collinsella sp.]|nr:hypothetical protein [Collinsella sp.]